MQHLIINEAPIRSRVNENLACFPVIAAVRHMGRVEMPHLRRGLLLECVLHQPPTTATSPYRIIRVGVSRPAGSR